MAAKAADSFAERRNPDIQSIWSCDGRFATVASHLQANVARSLSAGSITARIGGGWR